VPLVLNTSPPAQFLQPVCGKCETRYGKKQGVERELEEVPRRKGEVRTVRGTAESTVSSFSCCVFEGLSK